jgi:hypothetical protein
MGNIQREITVNEDSIVVNNVVGRTWFTTFKFETIQGIQLIRPKEWSNPYGGMVIASETTAF